jgi:hypothetical protein
MGDAETDQSSASAENLLENSPLVIVGQILCIFVPLAVWFAPLPLEPVTKRGFAIVGFMVVAWITRAMDYALAGFVGCFLFWALGVVKFPVAFSGFANDTAWFLFGAKFPTLERGSSIQRASSLRPVSLKRVLDSDLSALTDVLSCPFTLAPTKQARPPELI